MNLSLLTRSGVIALTIASNFFTPPVFAQTSTASPILNRLTLKDIEIVPPVLMLFPFIHSDSSLQFEEKDGNLLFTQPPTMWSDPKPDSKILWSGKFGAEPQNVTLEVTASEEDFKDDTGQVVWSEPLEEPSLTIDFTRRNHLRLLDSQGKELGFAPVDNSSPPAYQPVVPFQGKAFGSDGIWVVTDTGQQRTTVYSGNQLMWSGPRPANDGVRFGLLPGSRVYGIPTADFPVGTRLTFAVSRDAGSVIITDEAHQLLETKPADTLHCTILTSDEKFRKSIQNWFLFISHIVPTQVKLNAPGKIDAEYRAANGEWAGKTSIHTTVELRHVAWSRKPQTYLDTEVANFDKTGKLIGTFQDSSQPLHQE